MEKQNVLRLSYIEATNSWSWLTDTETNERGSASFFFFEDNSSSNKPNFLSLRELSDKIVLDYR